MNKLINIKFLTFDELLARWNLGKQDIHRLISNAELVPSIIWDGWLIELEWKLNSDDNDNLTLVGRTNIDGNPLEVMSSSWIYLRRPKALGAYKYSFTLASSSTEELTSPWYQLTEFEGRNFSTPAKINQDDIETKAVFMMDEIEDFESMHKHLAPAIQADCESHSFNFEGKHYPIELDFALKAWIAVTNSEGKGKPKARIRAWLDANTNLSNEAKERIAIVANWDKLGGATKTN